MSLRDMWNRHSRRVARAQSKQVAALQPQAESASKGREKVKIEQVDWKNIRDLMYAKGSKFGQRAMLYDLMFHTGAAIGEVIALIADDIRFEVKDGKPVRIHVNIAKMKDDFGTGVHPLSKRHHLPRVVPIICDQEDQNDLGTKLHEYLRFHCPRPDSQLFPMSKNNYLKLMKDDAVHFGFKFRSHDFRRTFLTDLGKSQKVSVLVAADLVGHRKVETTERYFFRERSSPEARAAVEELEKLRGRKN
jgi:integrase